MKNFARVGVLIVIQLVIACDAEEEITPRSYPRVKTRAVTSITNSGATFSGNITYTSVDILDHGFVWSELYTPTINTAERISLGPRSQTGSFTATMSKNLKRGKKYYVRAYARSEKNTVYGEVVEFVNLE